METNDSLFVCTTVTRATIPWARRLNASLAAHAGRNRLLVLDDRPQARIRVTVCADQRWNAGVRVLEQGLETLREPAVVSAYQHAQRRVAAA